MSNQISGSFFTAVQEYQFEVLDSLYQESLLEQPDEYGNPPLLALLEQVTDIDNDNYTPKELESLFARIEATVAFLVSRNANVCTKGALNKTALGLVDDSEIFTNEGRKIRQLIVTAAQNQKKSNQPDVIADVTQKIQELSVHTPPLQTPTSATLEHYLKLLSDVDSLDTFDDILKDLSSSGKNVLHYIAEQPDFSPFKEIIRKHYNHPLFTKLLTQETDAEQVTPLHVMALHHNVAMLRWIRTSSNPQIVDFLKLCGSSTANATGCNVFHCLGRSHGNTKMDEIREFFTSEKPQPRFLRHYLQDAILDHRVCEMFEELVQLYGKEEATNLGANIDNSGCTLLTYSCFTGDSTFTDKIIDFFCMTERAAAVIVSQTSNTFVSPLDILVAIGRPESVVSLLKFNKIATKEAFWLGSSHFKTRSALDMCCVTRCVTQEEKQDFLQICHLFLNHLISDSEEFERAIAHKSQNAQEICRLLRACDNKSIEFLHVDKCVSELYQSHESEKITYKQSHHSISTKKL